MNVVTLWRRGLTGLRVAGVARTSLVALAAGVGALLWAGPVSAQSQDWGDRGEVRRDTREMRVDRAQWFADRMDVRRLKRMVLMLDRAQVAGDRGEERRIRDRIHVLLRQEMREARRDLDQDRREMERSRDELYRDYMERRGREMRDDRRDLRDDRRDTEESRRRVMREMEILRQLRQIQPAVERGRGGAMRDEDRLLHSFLQLAREDARADRREWNEDRRERREDVREREEMKNPEMKKDDSPNRDGDPGDWDNRADEKDHDQAPDRSDTDQNDTRDKDGSRDPGDWY